MAEEIVASEQNTELDNTAPEIINQPSLADHLDNSLTLAAKPKAIDVYKNVVGNPVAGSNPGRYRGNFADSLGNDLEKKLQAPTTNYQQMRPFTYNGDFDNANFERYYSTSKYKDIGFSPYRDNESLYNNKMTFGDQFVRAASQWDNLAVTGFKSGIRAWGDLFTDPLAPDIESAREMQKAMAIGNSNAGGFGGFVTNTFLNSAYTIGIAADFLAEEAALAAITAFTGGLSGEATLPGMAAKAGMATRKLMGFSEVAAKAGKGATEAAKAAKLANEAESLSSGIRSVEGVNDLRSFWNKVKAGGVGGALNKTLDILNPLENTTQALKTVDYATDYAKGIATFGAFADDIIHIKTAVSEAKLEGGMVKIDATKDMIEEYRNSHFGEDPTGEELQKIENLANQASFKTAFWNLPAIMTSNKLLYATMLAPMKRLMGRATGAAMMGDIVADKALKAGAGEVASFSAVGEGIGAKARVFAKSMANPKLYGNVGMNYLKANFAEGAQENIQEAISQGAIREAMDLYGDPRMAAYQGYMGYFMDGMKNQFSAQGAETFAGGFAMGMFAQPIMAAPAWSISKLSELAKDKSKIAAAKAERDAQIKKQVTTLNELASSPLKYFAPDLANAVKNGKLNDTLYEAVTEGNQQKAVDARDALEFNHIATALETGKYDLFIKQLKDYKNLSPEEAAEAFKKYGIDVKDAGKAMAQIDAIIERAESIRDSFNDQSTEFPNPYNPTRYEPGSKMREAVELSYLAWQKATRTLVFANTSFKQYARRIDSMAQAFSTMSANIAKGDAQAIMTLLTLPGIETEIAALRKEVAILKDVEGAGKERRDKQKRLELLEQFHVEMDNAQKTEDEKEGAKAHKKAKSTFKKYVKHLSEKNNVITFDTEIDGAYTVLKDSLDLHDARQGFAQSINVLSHPKGFLNLQYRLAESLKETYAKKQEQILENQMNHLKMIDFNHALQEVGKLGLAVPAEYTSDYKDALANNKTILEPTYFEDIKTGEKVTSGEKFDKALELWKTHLELISTVKEMQAEAEAANKKKLVDFKADDFETYPEDLVALLEATLQEEIKAGNVSPEMMVKEFAMTQLTAKKVINEYKERIKNLLPIEQNTVKKTAAQQDTLEKLKSISKKVQEPTKENPHYVIDGVTYDLRVTTLVDEILFNTLGKKKFALENIPNGGPELVKLIEDTVNNPALVDVNPKQYAKNIIKALKEKQFESPVFFKQFFEAENKPINSKFDNLLILLEAGISVEKVKEAVGKVLYEESTIRGNTIDNLGRDFFEGKTITKPAGMSDAAFKTIEDAFTKLKSEIDGRGEVIISRDLTLFGAVTSGQSVAGTMDLLVITPEGNFKIYDMKTASQWSRFGEQGDNQDGYFKKEGYALQLAIYKNLLENLTGVPVESLELLGFQTTNDLKGNISEIKVVDDKAKTTINYNTYKVTPEKTLKEVVSEYVPSNLEKGIDLGAEVNPEAKAQLNAMGYSNTQIKELSREERAKILTGGIAPEDYYKTETPTPAQVETPDVKETVPGTFSLLDGQRVTKNGVEGTIKVEGYGTIIFETNNVEYVIENAKSDSNPAEFNFKGITIEEPLAVPAAKTLDTKYKISDISERSVTVNDVEYIINTNSIGTITSVSPVNKPKQKLKNEKLLIAIEIERNKLVYDNVTPEIAKEVVNQAKTENRTTSVLEGIYVENFTDTVASGIDKLYNKEPLTEAEKLQVELWVFDTLDKVDDLLRNDEYKNNEEVKNSFYNLRIINHLLHEQDKKTQPETRSVEQAPVSKPIKKSKRTIKQKAPSKIEVAEAKEEAPVEEVSPIDLFNAMSIEEKWLSLIISMKPEDVLDVDNLYSAGVMQVKITTPGPHQGKILDVTNQLANAPRKVNLEDPSSVIMLQKITKDFKGDGKMRLAIEVNNYLGDVFGYVRENTPGAIKESPVETPVEKTATAEAISKDINIDTLRVAKQKNYEVMYESLDNPEKNGRYLITKITKNSVTLANLNDKITVKTKDLATNIKSVLDNVEPVTSVEDKKVIKENTKVKEEPKFTFTRLNKDERFKNTNDKTC